MERITATTPPRLREGHELRYRLASAYLTDNDKVVDAACGSGYGAPILGQVDYLGVDQTLTDLEVEPNPRRKFQAADLQRWAGIDCDVFIGYETIEHLTDYHHYLNMAKRARRLMFLSVPVVPTVGINPYHVHDFAPGQIPTLIEDNDWRLIQLLEQPSELSEVYMFGRR